MGIGIGHGSGLSFRVLGDWTQAWSLFTFRRDWTRPGLSLKSGGIGLGPVLLDRVQRDWTRACSSLLESWWIGLGPVFLRAHENWNRACSLFRVLVDWTRACMFFFIRVQGDWTRACSGCFSLESRGIGLGPVLDVGLDLWDLLHLLVVGLQQGVLVLRERIVF